MGSNARGPSIHRTSRTPAAAGVSETEAEVQAIVAQAVDDTVAAAQAAEAAAAAARQVTQAAEAAAEAVRAAQEVLRIRDVTADQAAAAGQARTAAGRETRERKDMAQEDRLSTAIKAEREAAAAAVVEKYAMKAEAERAAAAARREASRSARAAGMAAKVSADMAAAAREWHKARDQSAAGQHEMGLHLQDALSETEEELKVTRRRATAAQDSARTQEQADAARAAVAAAEAATLRQSQLRQEQERALAMGTAREEDRVALEALALLKKTQSKAGEVQHAAGDAEAAAAAARVQADSVEVWQGPFSPADSPRKASPEKKSKKKKTRSDARKAKYGDEDGDGRPAGRKTVLKTLTSPALRANVGAFAARIGLGSRSRPVAPVSIELSGAAGGGGGAASVPTGPSGPVSAVKRRKRGTIVPLPRVRELQIGDYVQKTGGDKTGKHFGEKGIVTELRSDFKVVVDHEDGQGGRWRAQDESMFTKVAADGNVVVAHEHGQGGAGQAAAATDGNKQRRSKRARSQL